MESSETPTRSYIIDLRDGLDFKENMSKLTEKQVDEVMENIIDNILEWYNAYEQIFVSIIDMEMGKRWF